MGTARAPELIAEVGTGPSKFDNGQDYFTALTKPLFFSSNGDVEAGTLNVATKVKVLESKDNRVKIAIEGWRKKNGRWTSHLPRIRYQYVDRTINQKCRQNRRCNQRL